MDNWTIHRYGLDDQTDCKWFVQTVSSSAIRGFRLVDESVHVVIRVWGTTRHQWNSENTAADWKWVWYLKHFTDHRMHCAYAVKHLWNSVSRSHVCLFAYIRLLNEWKTVSRRNKLECRIYNRQLGKGDWRRICISWHLSPSKNRIRTSLTSTTLSENHDVVVCQSTSIAVHSLLSPAELLDRRAKTRILTSESLLLEGRRSWTKCTFGAEPVAHSWHSCTLTRNSGMTCTLIENFGPFSVPYPTFRHDT